MQATTDVVPQPEKTPESRLTCITQLFARFFHLLASNFALFLFILSIISTFIGWYVFHISPFRPLIEIAHRQEQEKLKSRMVRRHFDLGKSFLNVGQIEQARREFESARKLEEYNAEAQLGLLKVQLFEDLQDKKYDPEVVKKRLELIEKEDAHDPHMFLIRGHVYQNIDSDEALRSYQEAIQNDPELAAAYDGMAWVYDNQAMVESDPQAKQEKLHKALEMADKALKLSDWNQTYANNLAFLYWRLGKYDEAIKITEELHKLDGRYLSTYYTLSEGYRLMGDLDKAYYYHEALLSLFEEEEEVLSLPRNNTPWDNKSGVRLYNYPEKKSYAYYSTALTAYLYKGEQEAMKYIDQAKKLKLPEEREAEVKKIISYEADELDEHGKLQTTGDIERTEKHLQLFRSKFL